ncbi:MAG: acetolactate synthase small subunit [Myxococcota bacterium]
MSDPVVRRHTISLLVENRTGVLARIAQLIAAKGYNIESVSVGETVDPSASRMTLVVRGDEWVIEQACKQLNRLIDVIKVTDMTDDPTVDRELVMVRVKGDPEHRGEICRIADIFRANIVDATPTTFTLELTGNENKICAFIEMLRPIGLLELYRTGKVVMVRGSRLPERTSQAPI